MTTSTALYG